MMNGAFGFNGMNGMFPMDFSQMMANGMQMPMGAFPGMMGKQACSVEMMSRNLTTWPGMGMDQMMNNQMSQMFSGFGGPNAGMNGMNMGMGYNGQGQYGDGSWMGQNYNGNGGYGGQGGYNMSSHQGNYNHYNSQNDYHNGYGRHGHQNYRGNRGRGRGYYNRNNNYGQMHHGNQNNYGNDGYGQHMQQQRSYQGQWAGSKQGDAGGEDVNVPESQPTIDANAEAQMLKELGPGGEDDFKDETNAQAQAAAPDAESHDVEETEAKATTQVPEDGTAVQNERNEPQEQSEPTAGQADAEVNMETTFEPQEEIVEPPADADVDESKPHPIQTFMSDETRSRHHMPPPGSSYAGPPNNVYGNRNPNYHGYGHANANPGAPVPILPVEPQGLGVAGAPTGPKAMRQGLPNTGRSGRDVMSMERQTPLTPTGPAASERSRR